MRFSLGGKWSIRTHQICMSHIRPAVAAIESRSCILLPCMWMSIVFWAMGPKFRPSIHDADSGFFLEHFHILPVSGAIGQYAKLCAHLEWKGIPVDDLQLEDRDRLGLPLHFISLQIYFRQRSPNTSSCVGRFLPIRIALRHLGHSSGCGQLRHTSLPTFPDCAGTGLRLP